MSHDWVEIDGSYGEGGGQILRTSLALAALTGRRLRISRIRAGRRNPGLAAQHLTAARAAAAICNGLLHGDEFGSQELEFVPGEIRPGRYEFNVAEERDSAGAASLVLQAILPALLLGTGQADVIVHGGTNVSWSPCFEYLEYVFAPCLGLMGVEIRFHRFRAGFYPHGGGTVVVEGALRGPIAPLRLEAAPVLSDVVLISVVSNRLPSHIGPRQLKGCREALLAGAPGLSVSREIDERPPSGGPGTSVIAVARGEHIFAGFSAIGERGKPAEKVGATAGAELAEFVKTRAHLDHYLSDQILIYAALAENQSTWTTSRITEHFRTNTYVIQRFLPVEVTLSEEERERWRVWVTPRRSASSNIPAWEMPKGGRKNG